MRRRTLAKGMCEQQAIELNSHAVKAGHAVSVGDRISIHTPERSREIEVLWIPVTGESHAAPPATREQRAVAYRVLSEETPRGRRQNPSLEVISQALPDAGTPKADADPLASVKTSPE